MNDVSMRPVAIKIEAHIRERMKLLGVARQRSPHWLMREAIHQYVEREEKRAAFRQDATAAWNQYQANGLHVSAEEADAWLAKLEAGEDALPPKAHP